MRYVSLISAVITFVLSAPFALPSVAQASTSHAYEAMPNFVGMGRSQVFHEMFTSQLYFKTTGLGANSSQWVRVVGELPAAGTRIQMFSTVTLEVTYAPTAVTAVHRASVKKNTVRAVVRKSTVVKRRITTVAALTGSRSTISSRPTSRTSHPRPENSHVGVATWYSYIPGQCATWYIPRGTRINVEDLLTHKVISCVVTDLEASHGNRAVDLSETQFGELAPLSVGVVPVRVTW